MSLALFMVPTPCEELLPSTFSPVAARRKHRAKRMWVFKDTSGERPKDGPRTPRGFPGRKFHGGNAVSGLRGIRVHRGRGGFRSHVRPDLRAKGRRPENRTARRGDVRG